MPINNNKIRQLNRLREKVQEVDNKLLDLLAKRFTLTNQIQGLKKAHGITLLQKKREQQLLAKYLLLGKTKRLSKALIKDLFQLIFSYSKKTGIMRGILNSQHGTKSKARNRR